MPTFNTKTTSSKQIWASPDGQRVIFEVTLDYQGQPFTAKTYSKDISNVGWSGEVETYEKQGQRGSETFVKQSPKEGFTPSSGSTERSSSGKQDQFTMYLSYAKDIAIGTMTSTGQINEAEFKKTLALVLAGGHELYDGRPGAEPKAESTQPLDQIFGAVQQMAQGGESPWGR